MSSCCCRLTQVHVLVSGEQYGEEFGKINLIRKAPALRDGDFCLAERWSFKTLVSQLSWMRPCVLLISGVCLRSIAILLYLAEKFKTPDYWYPADLHQRARVNEYLSWQHMTIRLQGSKVFWLQVRSVTSVTVTRLFKVQAGGNNTRPEFYMERRETSLYTWPNNIANVAPLQW